VRRDTALCHVRVMEGLAHVSLAAPEEAALDRAEAELRELIPRPPDRPDDDRSTVIRFWYHSPHGAATIARRIAVPDWQQIRRNYPSRTVDELGALMDGWRPGESGRPGARPDYMLEVGFAAAAS